MVKICPRCGYPNPDNAVYCSRCGYPLPKTPYQPMRYTPYPPPYPRKSNNGIIIAIVGSVLAVIIVLTVFLVIPSSNFHFVNNFPNIQPSNSPLHAVYSINNEVDNTLGGQWNLDPSISYTATYIGNGEYQITFGNGYTEVVSESQLQNYIALSNEICSYADAFMNVTTLYSIKLYTLAQNPPTSIDNYVYTQNNECTAIAILGWNTMPNPADRLYNEMNTILTNYMPQFQQLQQQWEQEGIYVNIFSSNGFDWVYFSITNQTILQELSQELQSAGYNIQLTAFSGLVGANNFQLIVIATINYQASQGQLTSIATYAQTSV